jgi:hypothetical protein
MTTASVPSVGGRVGSIHAGMLQALIRWEARLDLVVSNCVGAVCLGYPGGTAAIRPTITRAETGRGQPAGRASQAKAVSPVRSSTSMVA